MIWFSSVIDAVVCSVDAAFSSEMEERFTMISSTFFLATSQDAVYSRMLDVSELDLSMPASKTLNRSCVSASFFCWLFTISVTSSTISTVREASSASSSMIPLMIAAEELDCSASCWISVATTANPFPASPARAASMLAFSESKFV